MRRPGPGSVFLKSQRQTKRPGVAGRRARLYALWVRDNIMRIKITRIQKALLVWSVLALIAAEYIRWIHFSPRIETFIGLLELLVAIVTGLALGISLLAGTKKDWAAGANPPQIASAGR